MSPYLIYGGAFVGASFLAYLLSKEAVHPIIQSAVTDLLIAESDRQGVPAAWTLAWVQLESNFDPDAIGDRAISARWQEVARDDPRYVGNPYLDDQHLWVSYGLFQLASPFWLAHAAEAGLARLTDSPEVLLDPEINVRLGVGMLRDLRARTDGDFVSSRYIAAGCASRDCARAGIIASNAARVMDQYGVG